MRSAYLKYITALLLFGTNGVVAHSISMNSWEIVFWRTLLGGMILLVLYLLTGGRFAFRERRRDLFFVVFSGVAMGTSWMFLYEAYARIGVSLATLAYYLGPVLVVGLAPLVFRERITAVKLAGLLAALTGLAIVNGGAFQSGGLSFGLLCGFAAALFYAVMVLFNKKALRITGLENALVQLAASFVTVAVFTLVRQGAFPTIHLPSLVPILFLGIVNTGFGCYLYFSSIGRLAAGSVSLVGYLEPLSALVFSALFLNEHLTPLQLAGAGLLLIGSGFGVLFPNRKNIVSG